MPSNFILTVYSKSYCHIVNSDGVALYHHMHLATEKSYMPFWKQNIDYDNFNTGNRFQMEKLF